MLVNICIAISLDLTVYCYWVAFFEILFIAQSIFVEFSSRIVDAFANLVGQEMFNGFVNI